MMDRMTQVARPLLLVSLAWLAGGCAELIPIEDDVRCQAAMDRLVACGATVPSTAGITCDPDRAEALSGASCDTIVARLDEGIFGTEAGIIPKSRQGGKNGFACWLGFNFACPEPACIPDPSVEPPTDDDPCSAYLAYEGCGACEYYRCREKTAQCGDDAYLKGFVGKYCDRFATVTEPRVSDRAAQWLSDVRQCLVTELDRYTDEASSCEEIRQVGIDSHASCYVENGFCDLNIADWFAIVHTIDPFDVPFKQVLVTGNACLRQWFGWN